MSVSGVRLYAPSLNTYDGIHADAELIITHQGGGKSLYVCIPVISSKREGSSPEWFSKCIPWAPSKPGRNKSINVSNFTLNDVIPKAAFTVYENGTFDWNCGQDNVVILFHKNVAITMKKKEYKTLTSLIKKSTYVKSVPDYLTFNKKGTTFGPGKSTPKTKSMTCTPITYKDGTIIPPDENKRLNWVKPDTSSVSMDQAKYIMPYLIPILILIAAIFTVGMLGYGVHFATKYFTKTARPAPGNQANV